ncbi:MAG: penicillin-binding protein 2, partial [Candidatus Omnitrophica bacterium]|nr:penicillin-binding protein 2 [Candidatus Omnitrophota bacterium]
MYRTRQYFVFFAFMSILLFLFARLFCLQVIDYSKFSDMASEQHNKILKIEPRRGTIFDRFMEPLAINLDAPSVYCDPRAVKDKERTSGILAEILRMDRSVLLDRVSRDKAFVWIKRKVDPETAEKIKKHDLSGIHFLTESKRKYSNDNMAAHVIGFVGIDNDGLEGLEFLLDDKLKGKPGWRHLVRDARMRTVLFNEEDSMPAQNGYNLVLTIDSVIQFIVEEELQWMVDKFNAKRGSVIVMDPYSGRILALANYPDYDLNKYFDAPRDFMKDSAVASVYEPGSVFKIVTASAALNEEAVEMDTSIFCENGEFRTRGRILHDYHPYGRLIFTDVIVKSSNIGTVKVAQELGKKTVYDYVERFGFGRKTGIDLPGEVGGISRHPSKWSRSDITTIPIGQGIA